MKTVSGRSPKIPQPWEGVALIFVQLVTLLLLNGFFSLVSTTLGIGQRSLIYFAFVGEILLAIPLLLWVGLRQFSWRETFYLCPTSWRMVVLGVILGVLVWPIISTITIPFDWLHSKIGPAPELPTPQTTLEAVIFGITVIFAAPLIEEPMFRGFVLRSWTRFGFLWAVAVTGILFGMLHGQLAQLVGLIFVGMLLAAVTFRSGSILPAIVLHGTFNTLSFVYLLLQNQLAWISDWYLVGASVVTLPLLVGGLFYLYRTTRPNPGPQIIWPDTNELILISISAMLVVGTFSVLGLLDIISRLIPPALRGL